MPLLRRSHGQSQHSPSLWRNRDYLRLWSGQTVSAVGTEVSNLAFPCCSLPSLARLRKLGSPPRCAASRTSSSACPPTHSWIAGTANAPSWLPVSAGVSSSAVAVTVGINKLERPGECLRYGPSRRRACVVRRGR